MPVYKRFIEPVNISRTSVPSEIHDVLECVNNNTMAHVILQLSSLSRLSEDLFSELHVEACNMFYRTCQVIQKVELLKQKIFQLNPVVEEVSLHDINQQKQYKSSIVKDQEIISAVSRPTAIREVYECLEPAPSLFILDPYREDQKESIKFYTDPGYFFELWKQEITKDTENQMKKQKDKIKRRITKDMNLPNEYKESRLHTSIKPMDFSNMPDFEAEIPHDYIVDKHQITEDLQFQGSRTSNMNRENLNWNNEQLPQGNYPYGIIGLDNSDPSQQTSHNDLLNNNMQPSNWTNNYEFTSKDQQLNQMSTIITSDTDEENSKLHMKNANYYNDDYLPTPPSLAYPSQNNLLNDSNFFPSPPSNILEGSKKIDSQVLRSPHEINYKFEQEKEGYRFSEGVQDLLNMIEGIQTVTPDKNTDDRVATDLQSTSPPRYSIGNSAVSKSPANASMQLVNSQTSPPSATKSGRYCDASPDHLNTSNQRIVKEPRSDLLSAIRKGIQLRKVEERRIKIERKATRRLDVQSIMEAAFEIRRKAMEDNESDGEVDDDEGGWSDEA